MFTFARLLREGFASVPDPRIERTKLHPLSDILMIALCTILCGGEGYEHMPEWAKLQGEQWLKDNLGLSLPHGIAHHDTFRRVLSRAHPGAVEECLLVLARRCQSKRVAIDGKELRHSFDAEQGSGDALMLLNAWAGDLHIALAQEPVPVGGNEISALENLLAKLELGGATVTADAMHCQKETVKKLRGKEADYVLSLKENHPLFFDAVSSVFAQAGSRQGAALPVSRHQQTDGSDHGRVEVRCCHVIEAKAWLPEGDPLWQWQDLRSLVLLERYRALSERGEKKESLSHGFYISSLEPSAERHLEVIRSHWGIENRLHWVLDVVFGEDESRVRRDFGPRNLALLRRLSLSIARHAPAPNKSLRLRRKMAGWSSAFLLQCLASWPVPQAAATDKEGIPGEAGAVDK